MSDESSCIEMSAEERAAHKDDLAEAEQGSASAQYKMGYYYIMGKGVPYDREKALYWLKKSAEQGYEFAVKEIEKIQSDEARDKLPKPFKDPARDRGGFN